MKVKDRPPRTFAVVAVPARPVVAVSSTWLVVDGQVAELGTKFQRRRGKRGRGKCVGCGRMRCGLFATCPGR